MTDEGIEVRAATPDDWNSIEALFGQNGACGGCWCMHWHMERGADWDREKGSRNKRAFKRRVTSGAVHGCLAFDASGPIGWCCFGPRRSFARLTRSRVLVSDAGDDMWAVVCFYIPARHRRRGVGRALLADAVRCARRAGARGLEGYPVYAKKDPAAAYPATFAFVGVPRMFERAGFRDVTPTGAQRKTFRRRFRRSPDSGADSRSAEG